MLPALDTPGCSASPQSNLLPAPLGPAGHLEMGEHCSLWPQPSVLICTVPTASCISWDEPLPWVPRGCSSSRISSVVVVGQVQDRWRSSDSGKESLPLDDLGTVPASLL